MQNKLSDKSCKSGNLPLLTEDEIDGLLEKLEDSWEVITYHHLEKEFSFNDFSEALKFTNKVGEIAEDQDHHPDILLSYGKVKLTIWTHKGGGLTENDFIFAAKVDELDD